MTDYSPQMIHKPHDPTISFEEYLYYAKDSRTWEDSAANVAQPGFKGPQTALKDTYCNGRSNVKLFSAFGLISQM
jgi:hypothetical protein